MKRLNIKYLLISVIIILALSLSSGCAYFETSPPPPSPPPAGSTTPINPGWTPAPVVTSPQLPSIADTVAKVRPSVAAIDVEVITYDIFNRPITQQGAGSGWVIDKNGIVVTNNHVVESAKTVTVTLSTGETYPAKQIRTDPLTDLAVITVDAQNLPALNIGDSSRLRIGDWVVAIGNSLGLGISATNGIVSRTGVSLDVGEGQTLYDLIQTNAAINPGNSGGPLVNLAGEVIGITSAKLSAVGIEGMGYAISINVATPVIQALINEGYVVRPWLGVGLQTVNQTIAFLNRLSVNRGVMVTQVAQGSPADRAGLIKDDVIVGIDSKEISTAQELMQAIHSAKVGQTIGITFWRGDSKKTTEAVLVENPPPS